MPHEEPSLAFLQPPRVPSLNRLLCCTTATPATHPYGGGCGQCLLLQHLDDLLLPPRRLYAARLLHVGQQVAPRTGGKHRRGVVGRGRAVAIRDRPDVLLQAMGCVSVGWCNSCGRCNGEGGEVVRFGVGEVNGKHAP